MSRLGELAFGWPGGSVGGVGGSAGYDPYRDAVAAAAAAAAIAQAQAASGNSGVGSAQAAAAAAAAIAQAQAAIDNPYPWLTGSAGVYAYVHPASESNSQDQFGSDPNHLTPSYSTPNPNQTSTNWLPYVGIAAVLAVVVVIAKR